MVVDLPRETALKILYDINEKGAYSNIAIDKHLDSTELKAVDRGFITELVYGTVKWRLKIDWVIEQFSNVKLRKLSPWILNILRMGIYQLIFTDRVPESAACNESVKLAGKYGHQASRGYVNGILRNIARNKNSIKYPDENADMIKYLSVKYSHPEWLVEKWLKRYGREFAEGLLESNNGVADLTVRANTLKTSRDELIRSLNLEGMEAEAGKYISEAIRLNKPSSITGSDLFSQGLFQVQDESSMLVAHILDPKPGELVMDLCSAPGGKATHIAQLMENRGTVIARDIHPHKIRLIAQAAERLGTEIVKPEVFDALKLDHNYIGKADKVLVDAPCTGYGILRRKPDIKWSRNLEDQNEIVELQKKILEIASEYVKPGGMLIYSTCTIEPEENEDVVEEFVISHSEFEFCGIEQLLPGPLAGRSREGYLQLFPNIDGIDGFFIAKMRKKGD
jgi:16S rRNA (cytosine967-C5)-methyltransferase